MFGGGVSFIDACVYIFSTLNEYRNVRISAQRMSVKLLSWYFYFSKNNVGIQVQGF